MLLSHPLPFSHRNQNFRNVSDLNLHRKLFVRRKQILSVFPKTAKKKTNNYRLQNDTFELGIEWLPERLSSPGRSVCCRSVTAPSTLAFSSHDSSSVCRLMRKFRCRIDSFRLNEMTQCSVGFPSSIFNPEIFHEFFFSLFLSWMNLRQAYWFVQKNRWIALTSRICWLMSLWGTPGCWPDAASSDKLPGTIRTRSRPTAESRAISAIERSGGG